MAFNHELSISSLIKLTSFLAWSGLYLYSSAKWPNKCPEWHSRLVTLLHGSVATTVGLSQCGITNLTTYRLTTKISLNNYLLMVWSWGYFAFDLLWCLIYWSDSLLMLCHHTSALVAITIYMRKLYTGCTFACTLALLEITNPLLQTRWFLRDHGLGQTLFYQVVEVTYLALFLIVRGVIGTYLVYRIMKSQLFDIEMKLITAVFYAVSVAFVYDILGYVLYRYRNKIGAFTEFLTEVGLKLNQQQ